MNVAAIMDALGAALEPIPGLIVHPYWAQKITPDAAIVGMPETIDYDATYGGACHTVECSISVLTARPGNVSARDRIAAYANDTGARSVPFAIGTHDYAGVIDDAHVVSAGFVPIELAGTTYLAAIFSVRLSAPGS